MVKAKVKCDFCGKPAHREGPDGWGICKACDDKLDAVDKRVLVDVLGGVVQEVYVTTGLGAKIFKIDWDDINEGDADSEPWVEFDAIELTHDEFRAKLKEAKAEHTRKRTCKHCGASPADHDEASCPKKLWENNHLQFTRVLAALFEHGVTDVEKMRLAEKLGVSEEQIVELLRRATDLHKHNVTKFGID